MSAPVFALADLIRGALRHAALEFLRQSAEALSRGIPGFVSVSFRCEEHMGDYECGLLFGEDPSGDDVTVTTSHTEALRAEFGEYDERYEEAVSLAGEKFFETMAAAGLTFGKHEGVIAGFSGCSFVRLGHEGLRPAGMEAHLLREALWLWCDEYVTLLADGRVEPPIPELFRDFVAELEK